MLKTCISSQLVFHVTSLLCDNDVAMCFKIVNHGFASFIIDASDLSSDVCFAFLQICGEGL